MVWSPQLCHDLPGLIIGVKFPFLSENDFTFINKAIFKKEMNEAVIKACIPLALINVFSSCLKVSINNVFFLLQ